MIKGQDIRAKREKLKLTVKELASMLEVSEANLYKWEKGTGISDPEAYNKLKNWLENIPRENGSKSNDVVKEARNDGKMDYRERYIALLEKHAEFNLDDLRDSLQVALANQHVLYHVVARMEARAAKKDYREVLRDMDNIKSEFLKAELKMDR